jgi:hypothetical protein
MKNKGEILAEILMDFKDCYLFLHNTREPDIAEKINNEGFLFESQLAYSTDQINPSEHIEITYFFIQRKDYGSYTIVIAIPKKIYEVYSAASNENDTGIENILTIKEPFIGDNEEPIYRLSPKHVLGYFNSNTGEFIKNTNWDPEYNNLTSATYHL